MDPDLIMFEGPACHTLGALPLEEGGGAKHSPPGDAGDKIW